MAWTCICTSICETTKQQRKHGIRKMQIDLTCTGDAWALSSGPILAPRKQQDRRRQRRSAGGTSGNGTFSEHYAQGLPNVSMDVQYQPTAISTKVNILKIQTQLPFLWPGWPWHGYTPCRSASPPWSIRPASGAPEPDLKQGWESGPADFPSLEPNPQFFNGSNFRICWALKMKK